MGGYEPAAWTTESAALAVDGEMVSTGALSDEAGCSLPAGSTPAHGRYTLSALLVPCLAWLTRRRRSRNT
jgi:hypothetical protein